MARSLECTKLGKGSEKGVTGQEERSRYRSVRMVGVDVRRRGGRERTDVDKFLGSVDGWHR